LSTRAAQSLPLPRKRGSNPLPASATLGRPTLSVRSLERYARRTAYDGKTRGWASKLDELAGYLDVAA
jgi:hypothetical protein